MSLWENVREKGAGLVGWETNQWETLSHAVGDRETGMKLQTCNNETDTKAALVLQWGVRGHGSLTWRHLLWPALTTRWRQKVNLPFFLLLAKSSLYIYFVTWSWTKQNPTLADELELKTTRCFMMRLFTLDFFNLIHQLPDQVFLFYLDLLFVCFKTRPHMHFTHRHTHTPTPTVSNQTSAVCLHLRLTTLHFLFHIPDCQPDQTFRLI